MKKILFVVFLLTLSVLLLNADYYIKQKAEGGGMGQSGQTQIIEQWIGKGRMATISADTSTIIDQKAKKSYIINHKNKTYVETGYPIDFAALLPEEAMQMVKGMIDGMTVSVKNTGEKKTIGKWPCVGYNVTIGMMGMEMKMKFWTTTSVKFDWKDVAAMQAEQMKVQFKMGDKFAKEFKKIKGFQIMTEMNMMGMNIKSEVVEISQKSAPAHVYKVPKGYTKKDKLSGRMR